jgi:hypothetical protein
MLENRSYVKYSNHIIIITIKEDVRKLLGVIYGVMP